MNQDNVHFLTGDKVGQVAVDFKAPDTNTRGRHRTTLDYHVTDDGSTQFQFSGYTDKHDYNSMPAYVKRDYHKYHQVHQDSLSAINRVVNDFPRRINSITDLIGSGRIPPAYKIRWDSGKRIY